MATNFLFCLKVSVYCESSSLFAFVIPLHSHYVMYQSRSFHEGTTAAWIAQQVGWKPESVVLRVPMQPRFSLVANLTFTLLFILFCILSWIYCTLFSSGSTHTRYTTLRLTPDWKGNFHPLFRVLSLKVPRSYPESPKACVLVPSVTWLIAFPRSTWYDARSENTFSSDTWRMYAPILH